MGAPSLPAAVRPDLRAVAQSIRGESLGIVGVTFRLERLDRHQSFCDSGWPEETSPPRIIREEIRHGTSVPSPAKNWQRIGINQWIGASGPMWQTMDYVPKEEYGHAERLRGEPKDDSPVRAVARTIVEDIRFRAFLARVSDKSIKDRCCEAIAEMMSRGQFAITCYASHRFLMMCEGLQPYRLKDGDHYGDFMGVRVVRDDSLRSAFELRSN